MRLEGHIKDLVSSLLYYDRKEDEDLGLYEIEEDIKNGEYTAEDIIEVFAKEIRETLTEEFIEKNVAEKIKRGW